MINVNIEPWAPIAGFLIGAIAGSFLSTLAVRWPAGRSIMQGRSCCDGCGATIPAFRLVPLLSYATQGGRCGSCRHQIDWRHPILELICGMIGGIAMAWRPDGAGAAGALFGWLLATLALLDRDHFWLPDRLTLPLGVIGLAIGPAAFPDRLVGAAAGYGALALIAMAYRRARGRVGLGQGDAKLLGAIGAWLGWRCLPWVVLGACVLGIGWALTARKRRFDRLPLGTLLAAAGWGVWLFASA